MREKSRINAVMLLLSAMMLAGCNINDYGTCPPDGEDEILGLRIELTVPGTDPATRTGGTRAEENVHGDGSFSMEDGSRLENMIDVDDYKVVVFDKDGAMAGDVVMEGVTIEEPSGGDHTRYTLSGTLHVSATEARTNLESFRIMVFANWTGFDTGYKYPADADFSKYRIPPADGGPISDEENLYKDGTNFNFTMPTDRTDGSVIKSWTPTDGSYIPMFGISGPIRLKDAQDMGKYSDNPVANIFMLRALAKIEIVDMVPDEAGANMERCVLTRSNKYGRFIPDITLSENAKWNDNDYQIGEPSLPENVEPLENLLFVRTTKSVRPKGADSDIDRDCFVAYIAEMDLNTTSRPNIQVKLEGSEQLYPIEFSAYDENGKPATGGEYSALLRNHIYRYDITSVGSTELDFVVETPWQTVDDDEWYYEDLKIGFESGKEFKWTNISDENYPSFEDVEDGEDGTDFEEDGLLNPERTIIISQDNWVEGAFTLNSPAKGTWTIALYGDDNTPNDQFRIDIQKGDDWEEGNDTYTGKVGEEVIFRIIPVAANNNTEHSRARVVLTCTSFDNQMLEVNLPYYHFGVTGIEMPKPSVDNNDYFYVKQYYSGFGANDE